MEKQQTFNHTIIACYLGYITQAIVNNFAPLLFLNFQESFGISLEKISLLIAFNFAVQLVTDLLSAKIIPHIGYRTAIVFAHGCAAVGLIGLAGFPAIFPDPFAGLMTAVAVYAVGGGLTEVLISPMVEACPTERKERAMGLLHSFYCWGVVGVIILSTLFFSIAGIQNWRILAVIWAVLPIFNMFFFLKVPIRSLEETADGGAMSFKELMRTKIFWVLILLMLCAGASELGMAQWASSFAEGGLKVSKTMGDLLGPCMFAVTQGISRMWYARISHRIDIRRYMIICSAFCVGSYLLAALSHNPLISLTGCGLCGFSVGVMWPGTFSMSSVVCPRGGTAMFAFLALAGDLGGSVGPLVIGITANGTGGGLKAGILMGGIFPVFLIVGLLITGIMQKSSRAENKSVI